MALPVRSQSALVKGIAEETGFSHGDVRSFFNALEFEIEDALKSCERARFAGLTVEPVLRKATKKRMGRNPRTGEEVEVSAKPSSVRIAVRVAKPLKEKAPSPKKLKRAVENASA